MTLKQRAKKLIDGVYKTYITSDNSLYVVKRSDDISKIKKHCSENGLTLFDVEANKEVELKKKKVKNGQAQS